ncbi:MAG: hypothetical protein LBC02_06760 [Planctomycetaceae bacterium]|jgi:hypothetical protein|nr:hypothetical protein [Planctomycetaceae bacterium]
MITTIFEDKYLEGEAKGQAKTIVTVLEARFGEVPKNIVKSINSYSNPNVLESWAKQAATCKSLKEFAAALK